MKTKHILLVIATALVFIGCSRDEESLFDSSASERLKTYLTNAENTLVAPVNGWEMLYFPNPESAGYPVLLKFTDNGQVKAASCNPQTTGNKYKEDSKSTWAIKADYGPILTFDTYNDIMHAWADPQTDGDGFLGDYEFLILEANDNQIRLKGKKHEAYVVMYPMPVDLDWQEYFKRVNAERDMIVTRNNGTEFDYSYNGQMQRMTYRGGMMVENLTEGLVYPFVVRPNCITFERPLLRWGISAQNFTLDENNAKLISMDGVEVAFVPALTLVETLDAKLDNNIRWKLDTKDMGTESKAVYDEMSAALKKQSGTLRAIYMQREVKQTISADGDTLLNKQDYLCIEFKHPQRGVKQARYEMSYAMENDVLKYQYLQPFEDVENMSNYLISVLGGGESKKAKGEEMIKNLMCGDFGVTSATGSLVNPQQLYLTSTTSVNKKIKINAAD